MTGDGTFVAGRRFADRYLLVAPRGADEWDAVDETLRRNVVVHVLPETAEAHDKAHFAAEARALAGLPHRNVVATYDTGVDGGGASYRVDELPDGAPLDPGAVDDDRRVSFATQIARGIAEAHDQGLLHGSLTSGSVLVHADGRVKVRGVHLPVAPAGDDDRRADVDAVVNLVAALAPARDHPLRDLALGWRGEDPPATVADIVTALVALPDDDAEPLDDPHPTPVTGLAPRPRRRSPLPAMVGGVIAVGVAITVFLLLPGKENAGDVSEPVRALRVAAASFDPEVRPPTENEAQAPFAVDQNPATQWKTERYRRANFGNLKKGVGLVLRSEEGAARFDALRVRTPQAGWTYEIYVAASPAATLAGWGQPVARGKADAPDFTIPLNSAQGQALLVWITEPGPGNQTRIAELDITGRV